jgi:hypothetical protein
MAQTRFEFFPLSGKELPMTWEQMKAPSSPEHWKIGVKGAGEALECRYLPIALDYVTSWLCRGWQDAPCG